MAAVEPQAGPVVAIYCYKYLAPSMTFIYRQLLGVRPEVQPIVISTEVVNCAAFPYEPIYAVPRSTVGRLTAKSLIRYAGYVAPLTKAQRSACARYLNQHGVSLIHAHFGPSGIEILPVAEAAGIPLLVTFHGFDASQLLLRARYRKQLASLLKRVTAIAVSTRIANRLLELGADPERVHVHYIGIPLQAFAFRARRSIAQKVAGHEEVVFLQVASFVEKKGHRYTLHAFRELLAIYDKCRLVLVGDGPLRPACEALADKLGIRGKVEFLGQLPPAEVAMHMNEADAFVHHSVTAADGDEEGIPTSIMEAMGTGLPIISTYHAGIGEIVEDGVNGYLVPERDVQAYVEKLRALLFSTQDMGRQSYEIARVRLDMSRQNAKLVDLYRLLTRDRVSATATCS